MNHGCCRSGRALVIGGATQGATRFGLRNIPSCYENLRSRRLVVVLVGCCPRCFLLFVWCDRWDHGDVGTAGFTAAQEDESLGSNTLRPAMGHDGWSPLMIYIHDGSSLLVIFDSCHWHLFFDAIFLHPCFTVIFCIFFWFCSYFWLVLHSAPSHPISCTGTLWPFMFRDVLSSVGGRLGPLQHWVLSKNTQNRFAMRVCIVYSPSAYCSSCFVDIRIWVHSIVRSQLLRAIPIFHFYMPSPWSISITLRSSFPWLISP